MVSESERPRRSLATRVGIVAVGAIVAVAGGVAAAYALGLSWPEWPDELSAGAFRELILSWGMWGVLAAIGLMVVHSFIPFPAEFVAIANGMCFGPWWGTLITWVGAMLGAVLAFGLARALGRPFVERAMLKKDWQGLDDWLERRGGDGVFLGRFLPVISFNLINYAAGLTRMRLRVFLLATGLGILPMTVLMVVLGHRIEDLSWLVWLLLIAAGFAFWLVARLAFRRHRRWSPPDA